MNILVRGSKRQLEEFSEKFPDLNHESEEIHSAAENDFDLIFDFLVEDSPEYLEMYMEFTGILFLNSIKNSLLEFSHFVDHKLPGAIVGFNGLPTFFNRELMECTTLDKKGQGGLRKAMEVLPTGFVEVDDRVGMVTPRVVCMIINEAYYTVQEGTASRADIDMAMKLGTNYPFGPFEWGERIGINHVVEVLDAVYDDTRDERYKIAPLLRKQYYTTLP